MPSKTFYSQDLAFKFYRNKKKSSKHVELEWDVIGPSAKSKKKGKRSARYTVKW